ncbi:FGGY-family carbohydrate kinase [Thermatribacter velox]|uniref:FGGY-family carbohydrate kinase n=1 Tax=Thermatribacter velox TaxID=3039681 RepID=A0ABZ2YD47_9BACT
MKDFILAVDAGTSSLKAVVFDFEGREIVSVSKDYPTRFSAPGEVEQDPDSWWDALVFCLHRLWDKGIVPQSIAGVCVTGQMELCLPLDLNYKPLYPAILCSDMRAQQEMDLVAESIGWENFWAYTGNFPRASMTVAKILWLKKHLPDVYRATRVVVNSSKDYLLFCLAGVQVTDPTSASTTGILNIRKRTWEGEILKAAGISVSLLPPVLASTEEVGSVTPEAARATGLLTGCPVFNGAGDAGASSLGAGVFDPSRAYCYLGTTGWVATVDNSLPVKPRKGLFILCDPDPQYYILVAPLLNAGRAYRWAIEALGYEKEGGYARAEEELKTVPPGSGGVIFLPYLQGERSPFFDPHARGVFFGLSETTGRAEMVRAVLEGVSFAIRQLIALLKSRDNGEKLSFLTLIGGGSRSTVWPQILADVCGVDVAVSERGAGATCFGTFLIALSGYRGFLDQSLVNGILGESRVYKPSWEAQSVYEVLFPLYEKLYPLLKDTFKERAELGF